MWKPNESLDDYVVRPTPEVTSEPPPSVLLLRTGEVEVLKPLTPPEDRTKSGGPLQPLWFRRFLAVGSGALAMTALVLVSAILVGISDTSPGPEVAMYEQPDDNLTQAEEQFSFDVSSSSIFGSATGEVDFVPTNTGRRLTRPKMHLVASKPRRPLRPLPQPEQPKFFPTTLVIYAENGVINTRIEPWIQTSDKKTQTFNN